MPWLADTNVLSELIRPRPNAGVVDWARGARRIAVSVITVEEIVCGLAWKPNAKVQDWFWSFFEESCDVLPVTQVIAQRAGALRGERRREGLTRTQTDLLIGATAQVHALTLVTRNVRDVEGCRIPLLNPFV